MEAYIGLREYARRLDIEAGDTVFISSDAKRLLWDALSNRAKPELNEFIDGLIEAVGPKGSVIFPTYNWDFCSGIAFDFHNTECRTGTLGSLALERGDFKRTKHPIYSFAVYGRCQDVLCSMENKDSFGMDSPFAFFHEHNVKNYMVDVSLQHCFTFTHYVEQCCGVKYRFIKDFTAGYLDENGLAGQRSYSMFVRDLNLDVETTIDPIEEDLLAARALKKYRVNNSIIKLVFMGQAYEVLTKDITENKSRKLCTYKGQ
ncbi:MAG: AAC(3) family N-acetyltransferase [Oscillospiraceae bacterium]|nr:AAC(3) family N-acetyltransferase [Oscillospiraceae bacterium]